MSKWRNRRTTLAAALTTTALVALVGCSSSGTSGTSGSSTSVTASGTTSGSSTSVTTSGTTSGTSGTQQPQSLTFVNYEGGDAGLKYKNLVKSFESANPGVTVTLQTLPGDATYNKVITSRIQGDTAPDVVQIQNVADEQEYVTAHLLSDLGDQPWVNKQVGAVTKAANLFGGKTYTFVTDLNAIGVFYNKDIFAKQGISVPKTWDEFLGDVKKLRAAGITPMGAGAKDGWPLGVQAQTMATDQMAGTPEPAALIAGTKKFSASPQWKQVLDDTSVLVRDGAYDPNVLGIDWPSSANDFAAGKTAMLLQGDFALPAIRTANKTMNLGMFPLPYGKASGSSLATVGFGSTLAIPTNAKNKNLAEKFFNFLAGSTVYSKYLTDAGAFSSIQGVTVPRDPAFTEINQVIATSSAEYNTNSGLSSVANAAVVTGMQALLNNSSSPSAVITTLDQAQQK